MNRTCGGVEQDVFGWGGGGVVRVSGGRGTGLFFFFAIDNIDSIDSIDNIDFGRKARGREGGEREEGEREGGGRERVREV